MMHDHADHRPLISLIVPFRGGSPSRERIWAWLKEYWRHEASDFELVVGESWEIHGYSKTQSFNEGVSRATGKYLVFIDADAYVPASTIRTAVARMEKAERQGHRLFLVPYRRMFRLDCDATERVLRSDPADPYRFPDPPNPCDVENQEGSGSEHQAHWYGALCIMMPRAAFDEVGGFDPRFNNWGMEDKSALCAVDTLWAKHKTIDAQVLHLHHDILGSSSKDKAWVQHPGPKTGHSLGARYAAANGDRVRMRALVDEGFATTAPKTTWWHKLLYYAHIRNWKRPFCR